MLGTEQLVYNENDIIITGIVQGETLWLFNQQVERWSPGAFKEWLWAIEDILFMAKEAGIKKLMCYVKTEKAEKFATMLGFTHEEQRGEYLIMSQET